MGSSFRGFFLLWANCETKSLSRTACELVGLRSPLKALKEGDSSTYCYQSNPFLLHSPKAGLGFSLSNLFLLSSPGSVPPASPLYIVFLCSKFVSHSSPGSQPYSVSIVSLPTCARDLLQHIGPWFLLSTIVQPDCVGLLVFYTHFTFSLYELALCCIFSPSPLFLHSFHYFSAMLFLHCWSYLIGSHLSSLLFFWSSSKSFSQIRKVCITITAFCLFNPSLLLLYFLNQIFHFLVVPYFQCL